MEFILGLYLLALLLGVFSMWMLVDCATSRGLGGTQKIVWVLIILFTSPIGAVIYFLAGRRSAPVT